MDLGKNLKKKDLHFLFFFVLLIRVQITKTNLTMISYISNNNNTFYFKATEQEYSLIIVVITSGNGMYCSRYKRETCHLKQIEIERS